MSTKMERYIESQLDPMRAEIDRLTNLIRSAQSFDANGDSICPWCQGELWTSGKGHGKDCPVAEIVKGGG